MKVVYSVCVAAMALVLMTSGAFAGKGIIKTTSMPPGGCATAQIGSATSGAGSGKVLTTKGQSSEYGLLSTYRSASPNDGCRKKEPHVMHGQVSLPK